MDKILLALSEFRNEVKSFFSTAKASADQITELTGKLATAVNDIVARDTTIKELKAAAELSGKTLTAKDTELATLTASVAAEKGKVTETLAGLGVKAETIPAAAGTAVKDTGLVAKYKEITDPRERVAFYRKNKAAIDLSWE